MSTWSIKDSVNQVPPEGTYLLRFEQIESASSKDGNPMLKFKLKIVENDEEWNGKLAFVNRSLLKRAIGILGADLANTELFGPDEDAAPSDSDELAEWLTERLGGKVFLWEVKHREWQGRVQGDWKLVGPSSEF